MTNHANTCFACGEGHYVESTEDYHVELPEGKDLVVPKVVVLRCDKCGEETIPPASSRQIEMAVDQAQDTLPPMAVHAFLEQFRVGQTEAAEALGMGAKTLHRWARGTQRVSRSMGYFLRALMAHPQVFEWIRARRWRLSEHSENAAIEVQLGDHWRATYQARFPASGGRTIEESGKTPSMEAGQHFNAPRALRAANVR